MFKHSSVHTITSIVQWLIHIQTEKDIGPTGLKTEVLKAKRTEHTRGHHINY